MNNCNCTSIIKNPYDLTFDCPAAWEIIQQGNTKGIFQLEGNLGQAWAQKVKPNDVESLAALIAIIRPGVLETGMAQKFVDVRSGKEELSYLHSSLEPILKTTYGCLVYQEQSIKISQELAGFSLSKADELRRGLGKKKPEIISKLKLEFVEGCINKNIITKEQAEEIFSWIEKGQRYLFVKSHAVAYAIGGYWTAYYKSHATKEFFTSYLEFSKDKIKPLKEVRELVHNAKHMKIDVCVPSILDKSDRFFIKDNSIHFDLSHIKGVGKSVITTLNGYIQKAEERLGKELKDFTWFEFLILVLVNIKKDAVVQIIKAGGFDCFDGYRKQKHYEFNKIKLLTDKELDAVLDNLDSITTIQQVFERCSVVKKEGGLTTSSKRAKILGEALEQIKKPSFSLNDTIADMARDEMETLGVPLSFNLIESRDTIIATHTCEDIIHKISGSLAVACTIEGIRFTKTKKGDEMCFLEISDDTGSVNTVVVFPKPFAEYSSMIIENNTVVMVGRMKDASFIVDKIYQT